MTPREISERLALHAEAICQQLLPNGKRHGHEWQVGSVNGEPGESCSVRLTGNKAGLWADFASDEKGDLIHLYQHVKGVTLSEAIKWGKEYLGIRDERNDFYGKPRPRALKPTITDGISREAVEWFKARWIERPTLDAYGIRAKGTVIEMPYEIGGEVLMRKYRDIANKKKIWQDSGGTPVLFGWPAIPENIREVVITEGEFDAMAYYEQGIPALSIPLGAGTGNKLAWIDNEFDRIERFDTIYVSMDMDQAGQETVEEMVNRLGNHRCRVVNLDHKDANSAHMDGAILSKAIEASKYLDPKELKAAETFEAEVIEQFYPTSSAAVGISVPWERARDKFRLRRAEVTAWCGINGHGKTRLINHIAGYGMAQGTRWCIASMEMRPATLLKCLYQQVSGIETPSDELIHICTEFVTGQCWIVNITGTAKSSRLLELFRYAWRRYGINHAIIDSLSKCGIREDDYAHQKDFIDAVGDLARETGMHIHVLMHSRKGDNEDRAPNKMDAKGTGALTDMVDNVVSIWRNKPKEEAVRKCEVAQTPVDQKIAGKPDCIIQVHKQRHYDWEGKLFLWFDPRNHQYRDMQNGRPYDYISEGTKSWE